MARDGLFLRAGACCAALLLLSIPAAAQERDIAVTLAVQTALQQGRTALRNGQNAQAVEALEAQLARINGNSEYLGVLRDAYRAHVKDLRLARKDAEAEEFLKRLRVLDPAAAAEPAVAHAQAAAGQPVTARGKVEEPPRTEVRPAMLPPGKPDAGRPAGGRPAPPAEPGLLEKAESEFAARRYDAAAKLFEQAAVAGPSLGAESRERWAYCKLHGVVSHLNQPSPGAPSADDLEREVRLAMCLAPRLTEYGNDLIGKIKDRRGAAAAATPTPSPNAAPDVAVRHLDKPADGWDVAETSNFRVYHHKQPALAEKVARAAEATRLSMAAKWLGEPGADWTPRCDVFIHDTAAEYGKMTGVPANSPGHSTIRSEGGRVVGRRIDLHRDDENTLTAVLPHEATHVVLAGRFGDFPVPRWADEGVAVLSEPREKVDRHLRNLPQYHRDNTLLGVREIMQMNDYPNPRFISTFYAQSVSLVEFLTREKGPQTFSAFVKDGLGGGYEAALRKHYNIQGFDELDQRWRKHAFADGGTNSASKR
jgi:tetratricopeptide (TPR) repeat protein